LLEGKITMWNGRKYQVTESEDRIYYKDISDNKEKLSCSFRKDNTRDSHVKKSLNEFLQEVLP